MTYYNEHGEKAPDTFPVKNEEEKIIGWIFNPSNDPQWREEHGYTYDYNPAPHVFYTRLQIRRAMQELGIEEKLDALLDASEKFKKQWSDAQEIDLYDPIVAEALAFGTITQKEIDAIQDYIENHGVEEE